VYPNITDPNFELIKNLPPNIASAILEVHNKTGAPIEIVILVAISAMSTTLHGFALCPPGGGWMPLALYCIGIGPPVCGKSSAMREFYAPIRDFDHALDERRAQNTEWRNHPAFRDVLQMDVTWSSLIEALEGTGLGLTIADDDCFDLLKSDVMKHRGKLNRFFDGSVKESLIRRDHDRLVAYYPSVGICGLVPPDIYQDFQLATRNSDRKSGLASRVLFAHTSWGRRGTQVPNMATPALDEFHRLAAWFLEQRLQRLLAGQTERVMLSLSPDAQACWAQLKRDIEARAAAGFHAYQDSAGRATEKTWRIAAILHCYQAFPIPTAATDPLPPFPPIPAETIRQAWAIVEWSLGQFSKVFPPPTPKPPKPSRVTERQLEEARIAKGHLYNHLRTNGIDTMPLSLAQRLSWLSAHKFSTVLAHMQSGGQVEMLGGRDPIIRFLPNFFAETGFEQSRQWATATF
jgi:hypothetical protein